MKVIVYLGFTLLSILIQFCVMDFIHDRLQDAVTLDVNTSEENDDIKDIKNKSDKLKKLTKSSVELRKAKYRNSSRLIQPLSTKMTSTILDIFYDENISTTDFSFTTEIFTNTEVDNITEINFPVDIQPPIHKPDIKLKSTNKDCNCNLLHEVCDINCCCDNDCSYEELNLFYCNNFMNKSTNQNGVCYAYLFHNNDRYRNNMLDNMFCIVKINLPEKRKIRHKSVSMSHRYFKWRNYNNLRKEQNFKDSYKSGDPLWLISNGSISNIDLPSPLINDYCSKRKAVTFLKNEEIKCIVKLKDLEMFHILNLVENTHIISATNFSVNSSSLNCSTLHCANWTVFVCDDFACGYYNKSLHQPSCTGSVCTNIALKVDYTFYTLRTKIINATVKLYVQNISSVLPHMSQKIRVNFLLTNKSINEIVKYSGNPGYKKGLKVIISRAKSNYTENFRTSRNDSDKYYFLPGIKNGQCLIQHITDDFIIFGANKKIKCRYIHKNYNLKNNNEMCRDVNNNLQMLLFSNNTIAVSAYGNPQHSDDEWIHLNFYNLHNGTVYGKVDSKAYKILCYNLITKISLSFSFTRLNDQGNKILAVEHQVVLSNKSFTIENNRSIVITIDIHFIDVSKPAVFEYASNPHLDINLPKDFFFPSNKSHFQCSNVYYIILVYCHIIIFK